MQHQVTRAARPGRCSLSWHQLQQRPNRDYHGSYYRRRVCTRDVRTHEVRITSSASRNLIKHPAKSFSSSPSSFSSTSATSAATPSTTVATAANGGGSSANSGGNNFIQTGGSIFFPSLCLLTFGLGAWQTVRYFEKIDLVKLREEDLSLDPFAGYDEWLAFKSSSMSTFTSTSNTPSSPEATISKDGPTNRKTYRRVHLRGKFLHQHEILVGPRGPPPGALSESGPNSGRGGGGGMSASMQGYWVITPLSVVRGSGSGMEDAVVGVDNVAERAEGREVQGENRGWIRFWKGSSPRKELEPEAKVPLESASATADKSEEEIIVWINRGWIPRHYVSNTTAKSDSTNINAISKNSTTSSWERPEGIVHITAMESETETPGTFTPPSRLDSGSKKLSTTSQQHPPTHQQQQPETKKLLWMDREAIKEITQCPEGVEPHFFVEIRNSDGATKDDDTKEGTATTTVATPRYPVKPPREFVGEFKVTPEIHAGYAFTWFALSGAGTVMTRKLLRRVR
mmetsp:Transcript_13083/g.27657  ORF Transcript_13083/g.27657 Transcript_13083/m.27657 type:complete len:512 (-) Transcript_13083:158-1693(-)